MDHNGVDYETEDEWNEAAERVRQKEKVGMKRFWISWVQAGEDYRPLTFPPNHAVLGWWKSGETDEGATLCAAIAARHEADARDAILKDWPEALEVGDWRFFEERPADFRPNNRFPLSEWMNSRFDPVGSER